MSSGLTVSYFTPLLVAEMCRVSPAAVFELAVVLLLIVLALLRLPGMTPRARSGAGDAHLHPTRGDSFKK